MIFIADLVRKFLLCFFHVIMQSPDAVVVSIFERVEMVVHLSFLLILVLSVLFFQLDSLFLPQI